MEAKYTLYQWRKETAMGKENSCKHSDYGSCVYPCPWCGTIGFYKTYKDGKRRYRMCKWCGTLQNVGEGARKLATVKCIKCGLWQQTIEPKGKKCCDCGGETKLIKTKHRKDMVEKKKEIYEIHQYVGGNKK